MDADIASFEEMAAEGIFDQEFPGHLWIGFSVPSGSLESLKVALKMLKH